MKLNLKKVLPIAAVGLMAGITFAHATTLSDWPAPFVQAGQADVTVVVGENAASDSIAAADFTAALQAALGGVGGSEETTVEGESVKLDKSTNHYNLGGFLDSLYTSLDSQDLPNLLQDEKYDDSEGANKNKVDYTQELELGTNGEIVFYQHDDRAPEAGFYQYLSTGNDLYKYTLEFDDPVVYDTTDAYSDFVPTTIIMFGKTFTFTDVKLDSNDDIESLTFQSGETSTWLMEGEPITWHSEGTDYTVELVDVTENEDSCGIKVNDGGVVWIDVGETKNVGGLEVGVIDAKAVHQAEQTNDACQVNLGAIEFKIIDGQEIKVNDVKIDGTTGFIDSNGTKGELYKFGFSFRPDDKQYLASGQEFVDPAFGYFKIVFGGVNADYEEIKVNVGGDTGEITLKDEAGKELSIPVAYQDTSGEIWFADTTDAGVSDLVIVPTGSNVLLINDTNAPFKPKEFSDVKGLRFIRVQGGEAHMYEMSDLDYDTGTGALIVTIEDVNYGGTPRETKCTTQGSCTLDMLGESDYTININWNSTHVTFLELPHDAEDVISTLYQAELDLSAAQNGFNLTSAANLTFTEYDDYDGDNVAGESGYNTALSFNVELYYDTTDEEIQVREYVNQSSGYGWYDESASNDNTEYFVTYYGTKIGRDAEDQRWLTIWHPKEEVSADVFVTETPAVLKQAVGGTPGATLGYVTVADTELQSTPELQNKNLIVIGGSAVNRVAAELLGLDYPTYGSDPAWQNATRVDGEGKALLKIFENPYASDKIALLVAGWEAQDTQRAARALIEQLPDLAGKSEALLDTSQATAVVLE